MRGIRTCSSAVRGWNVAGILRGAAPFDFAQNSSDPYTSCDALNSVAAGGTLLLDRFAVLVA